jgi:hypothetical protein
MGVQIGLVGQRADLAVEVAALAARAGASLVSLGPGDMGMAGGHDPRVQVDLVLVDAEVMGAPGSVGPGGAPPGGGVGVGRPGAPVAVICRAGEAAWACAGAADLGCDHVVELPLGAPWLVSQLAPEGGSSVLAVVGAVGGVGATTVAIACAVGAGADCLLVDADPDSPGLDLPLGIPEGAGVRWSQIPDTSEPLDPGSLRSALPEVGGVWVVTGWHVGRGPGASGDPGGFPGAGPVAGVLGVGRAEFPRTVMDAGRGAPVGLTGPGDALALVLPATLAGVVAGRRALAGFGAQQVVVLLRPTGWLPADEVAEQLGVPIALEIPRLRRAAELADCGDLLSGRTGRALRTLGEQVWEHVG